MQKNKTNWNLDRWRPRFPPRRWQFIYYNIFVHRELRKTLSKHLVFQSKDSSIVGLNLQSEQDQLGMSQCPTMELDKQIVTY